MSGVDTAVTCKITLLWHRIFWGLLVDIAFVNAYVVNGLIIEKSTVKDFRRSVAQDLMQDLNKKKTNIKRQCVRSLFKQKVQNILFHIERCKTW